MQNDTTSTELLSKLPAGIDYKSGSLPRAYRRACQNLRQCESLNEALVFSSQAQAIGCYARIIADDNLRKMAERIYLRSVRRLGELLGEYDARGRSADGRTFSQAQAADDAGLSRYQKITALRVARLPADKFEARVEQDQPATITSLAAEGRRRRDAAPDRWEDPPPPAGAPSVSEGPFLALRELAFTAQINSVEDVAGWVLAENDFRLETGLEFCARVLAHLRFLRGLGPEPPPPLRIVS